MKIPLVDPVIIQIQIWQPLIAQQNILDTSERLLMLNRSRIRNGAEKGFAVAEIIEIAEKIEVNSNMRAASEIAVSDSRGRMFSAFAGDQGC